MQQLHINILVAGNYWDRIFYLHEGEQNYIYLFSYLLGEE